LFKETSIITLVDVLDKLNKPGSWLDSNCSNDNS